MVPETVGTTSVFYQWSVSTISLQNLPHFCSLDRGASRKGWEQTALHLVEVRILVCMSFNIFLSVRKHWDFRVLGRNSDIDLAMSATQFSQPLPEVGFAKYLCLFIHSKDV